MLSALIPSALSYSAMPLARQQIHQRCVQLGPLVLESDPRKFLTPTVDRDRTVSRRSEPSSRATLRPVTNRPEGTFRSLRYSFGGDHPSQTTLHELSFALCKVRPQISKGWYFNNDSTTTGIAASQSPTYPTHHLSKTNTKI